MIKYPPTHKGFSSCWLGFPAGAKAWCTFSDSLMSHQTQEDWNSAQACHWPVQLKTNPGCYLEQQYRCQCICNILKDSSESWKWKKYFLASVLMLDSQCLQTAVVTAPKKLQRNMWHIWESDNQSICLSASLVWLGVTGDVVLLVFVTVAAVCMAVAAVICSFIYYSK